MKVNWIMIKPLLLVSMLLASGVAAAGSYTNVSYEEPTLVLTDKHLRGHNTDKAVIADSSAELANASNNRGSWMTSLGEIEDQYHKDLEILIASKSRNGRSYARISDSSGAVVQYSGTVARASRSSNRNTFDIMIESIADKYGIERGLVKAIMHTESSFNPYAKSPVGAQGLMQLMPATARRFKVANSYDPQQNIEGGVKYLKWLMKRFDGNVSLVLAAYNAGEGNVDKYNGIPPFKETQNYVKRVLERYHGLYKHI